MAAVGLAAIAEKGYVGLLALVQSMAVLAAPVAEQKKRALIYMRASTEEANQRWKIEAQRERLRPYVKSHGWILVGEYEDRASGANTNRPASRSCLLRPASASSTCS